MSKITIQKASSDDLADIMKVYSYARGFMAENGNASQWGSSYPEEEILKEDIAGGNLYAVKSDGEICGAFAFISGEDETYAVIEDGAWISDSEYGTIHRVAGNGTVPGIFGYVLEFCLDKIVHLRIDTHRDNKIMQHVIEKNGFTRCGIIYCSDGTPRIAYERI